MKKIVLFILWGLFLHVCCLNGQEAFWNYSGGEPETRILIIFDESNSMNGQWETGKKIDIARKMLLDILDSLEQIDNIQLALRMYGHQYHVPPQRCSDTKLEVPFGPDNIEQIRQKLINTEPKGTTPIARSLEACARDFPKSTASKNIVILITDGIEECDGDPCAVALALQSRGIVLKPYIIGVGLDVELIDAFSCVGTFFNADKEDKLKDILQSVILQATSRTTCQVNLLDIHGNPTETNVNMTFYDKETGYITNNFVHTMNSRGNPDTLELSPNIQYKIDVHTIPKVTIEHANIIPGKHTIISTDAPQGTLLIREETTNKYEHVKAVIKKAGDCKILNVQSFSVPEKYIVGNYNLEILTLPRLYYPNLEIKQSKTTLIRVPQPGMVTIVLPAKGYASLYLKSHEHLTWLCNINHTQREVLYLQPGTYFVVYRSENMKRSKFTVTKSFEVISGRSEYVEMK